ncbi:MAG: fatty acid desaturase, partial [Proteobacteria bacterium]|nr:fatty acid desaturase [Pseudomonadota bacterium]
ITHKPWVWRASTFASDSINGISSLLWIYEHTYGHHVFTNIDGSDPNIKTINDGLDFWRIKSFQQWFPIYRFQHIYMPILYSTVTIKMKLQDFHSILIMKKGPIRMNQLGTYQLVSFIASKVIFFSYRLVLPYLFMPLSSIFLTNLAAEVTAGLWVALITQVTHVNAKAFSSSPTVENSGDSLKNDQTIIKQNWAEFQVASTVDYATDSWFLTVFTGAGNHQVAHHLFPGVLQTYYSQITPIIKRTCTEFGLHYNEVPSFWDALCCHLGYLKVMGAAPKSQAKG